MDKNTVIGFSLIFILMLGWFYVTLPSEEEIAEQRRQRAIKDSLAFIEQPNEITLKNEGSQSPDADQALELTQTPIKPAGMFGAGQANSETHFTIETSRYTAVFTNLGAGPSSFTLKDHKNWAGEPIQMIGDTTRSAYNAGFLTTENYNVDTNTLLFKQLSFGTSAVVDEGETNELSYALDLGDGRQLIYTYTFFGGKYEIDLNIRFVGIRDYIIGRVIDFAWTAPLQFTEKDPVQEALATTSYLYSGGELEQLKVTDFDENNGYEEQNVNGNVDWVATKTKFFSQIIKPNTQTDGAYLTGKITGEVDDANTQHSYTSTVTADIPSNGTVSMSLYLGPMRYLDVKEFDEHAFDMVEVSYGWLRWFSDPFVRFIVIPFFNFFSGFISNYGALVIIFSVIVKLILFPLTIRSYRSMAAMKELQPKMKEIQDKYKNDPQKQQKATMDLYRKNKVNPLGSCLPMLLQFPIIITLWQFFQNSIILRQKEFLWVSDLSAPDYILNLPFSIPFLGDQLAGFVLLMTISMVFQSRLTAANSAGGASNPMAQQMKIMQYFFPIMLLFIFNNFASGLSLYYLIFNVLSIFQQLYINKTTHEAAVAKAN